MSNNNYSANYNWLPNAAHKKAVNVAPINTKPTPTSTNKSNASSYKAPARQKEVSYKDIKPTKCLSFLKNLFCKKPIERLEFSPKAWLKINAYINLIGDLEITGLGKVVKIEGKDIITDIIINTSIFQDRLSLFVLHTIFTHFYCSKYALTSSIACSKDPSSSISFSLTASLSTSIFSISHSGSF